MSNEPVPAKLRNGMPPKKKRILVICPFPIGLAPAQRLKYEQYFDQWRQSGYEVDVSPFIDAQHYGILWEKGFYVQKALATLKGTFRRLIDFARAPFYDGIYVFLWVTPLGPPVAEWLLHKLARALIYDIDDNVHLGQDLPEQYNPNPVLRFLKGRGKPLYLMKHADYVICSSPFLEKEAQKRNKYAKSVYVSSSVDTEYFVPRAERPDNKKIVIGWTGTFSSRPFVDMLHPALLKLRKLRDFEFRIIGNFDYEMEGVDLKVVRFDKNSEIEDLCHFDIGVYPLPNDPWVLGKSGLKAIVYMAMGVPVVASAVGTTPLLFEHGEIGHLVGEGEDEWVEAFTRLIDDADWRKRAGKEARRVAVEHYSKRAIGVQYLKVLNEVLPVDR